MSPDDGPAPTATPDRTLPRRSDLSRLAGALERPLWALALLSLALDALLTAYGLGLGLVESNPVARRLIGAVGLAGAMLLLKGAALSVGWLAWRFLPRPHRIAAPLGLALPWTAAVGINLVVIVGAR